MEWLLHCLENFEVHARSLNKVFNKKQNLFPSACSSLSCVEAAEATMFSIWFHHGEMKEVIYTFIYAQTLYNLNHFASTV
jgi:ribosome biogenesis protein Tsr3